MLCLKTLLCIFVHIKVEFCSERRYTERGKGAGSMPGIRPVFDLCSNPKCNNTKVLHAAAYRKGSLAGPGRPGQWGRRVFRLEKMRTFSCGSCGFRANKKGGWRMLLSGTEIERQIELKNIVIEPFHKEQLNPNSYNLTLAKEMYVYTEPVLDVKKENPTQKIIIPEEGIVLELERL